MNPESSLTPGEALTRARDTTTAVRRAGRWRVAGWWIMTAFLTFHLLGNRLFPEVVDDWSLILFAVTVLLIGLLAFAARVHDRRSRRIELWFVASMLTVSFAAMLLYNLVVPDGVTVWAFVVGGLPLLVCLTATAGVLRR